MENKTILLFALSTAVLAIVSAFLYQDRRGLADKLAQTIAQNQVPTNTVKMTVVTVNQSDDFYNIQAEYPQIGSANPEFNQKITSTINGLIEDFKKEAKDNFDARNATMPADQPQLEKPEQPFDFVAFWTPAQISPRYASFIIDIYYFTGGAHGIDQLFAFNYDLQDKKEISIIDFLGGQAGLDKLARLAQDRVTSQLQSAGLQANDFLTQMIADGTAPKTDNYRNFTFGFDKLTIYFEQYQVAPGAAGTVTVTLYKNELEQNYINPDYLN